MSSSDVPSENHIEKWLICRDCDRLPLIRDVPPEGKIVLKLSEKNTLPMNAVVTQFLGPTATSIIEPLKAPLT